jgi:hypothetical protein
LRRAQDGRFFHQNAPFSGIAVRKYENGRKQEEAHFKDGQLHGSHLRWHVDGWKQMEMHYVAGVPEGEWTRWQANGLVERVEVWRLGESVGKRYGEHITKEVVQKETKRVELNNSIYAEEEAAQFHEKTFVALWDDIRAAEDKWKPLEKLRLGSLIPGVRGKTIGLDWDIRRTEWIAGGQPLTLEAWRHRLATLRDRGIELVETEWHQGKFESKAADGWPRSEFKFLFHIRDKAVEQRHIVRGKISVAWTNERDSKGHPIPGQVEVLNATIWDRKGALPFTAWHHLDPWRGVPTYQRQPLVPLLVYDLNRDGLSEVILAGSNLVYWNRGKGNFEKGTLCNSPLPSLTGAVVADFNGDGRADMLACSGDLPPALFVGDVQGRFSNPPKPAASIPPIKRGYAITAGDIDADGDLDVYLTQYKPAYEHGHMPSPFHDANDGDPAYLLENDGSGRFTDATEKAGLAAKRHRRTWSVSFTDLDSDRDLDLVVVNDFSGLDYYLNDGRGKFIDTTSRLGDYRFCFGMSHVLGDFNLDGKLDLYMVGMGSTTARRLETMGANREDFPGINKHRMKLGYGNRLLLGDGAGGMTQSPHNERVARTGWGWGSTAFDFDNDGDEDIYVGNGNISGKTAQDYCTHFWRHDIYEGNSSSVTKQSRPDIPQSLLFDQKMACLDTISWNGFEHNVLLMNNGTGVFSSIGWLMDVAHEFDSRSVVSDDLDADGRPDLLVIRADWIAKYGRNQSGDESLFLRHNQCAAKGNWIGVRLHEYGGGFTPVGAHITLRHVDGVLTRGVVIGDSILAQHSNHKHIGLGSIAKVEAIEVRWPNGQVSRMEKPSINRYHTIVPPKGE